MEEDHSLSQVFVFGILFGILIEVLKMVLLYFEFVLELCALQLALENHYVLIHCHPCVSSVHILVSQ